jgi:hypothetical protein
MSRWCLKNGRLQEAYPGEAAGRTPAAAFLLAADGRIRELPGLTAADGGFPEPEEGEGLFLYEGEFSVEPLEIMIEFLKAESAEQWLEALFLRHAERTRKTDGALWALAEIKEVEA